MANPIRVTPTSTYMLVARTLAAKHPTHAVQLQQAIMRTVGK